MQKSPRSYRGHSCLQRLSRGSCGHHHDSRLCCLEASSAPRAFTPPSPVRGPRSCSPAPRRLPSMRTKPRAAWAPGSEERFSSSDVSSAQTWLSPPIVRSLYAWRIRPSLRVPMLGASPLGLLRMGTASRTTSYWSLFWASLEMAASTSSGFMASAVGALGSSAGAAATAGAALGSGAPKRSICTAGDRRRWAARMKRFRSIMFMFTLSAMPLRSSSLSSRRSSSEVRPTSPLGSFILSMCRPSCWSFSHAVSCSSFSISVILPGQLRNFERSGGGGAQNQNLA
mmetsp:Transcript_30903/g.88607  ORF Transcript_30903/g.88607 Transcript_30903/m.88607 type:complete len:284 (+) Transcript_30903:80-931(+)